MQRLKIFQIDAFTSQLFRDNPAAVVPLTQWLDQSQMQSIAEENNVSETAFFIPLNDGYCRRWFTPIVEVPLCGHAILASAFVILTILEPGKKLVAFKIQSGILAVKQDNDLFVMDFPKLSLEVCKAPTAIFDGLKIPARQALMTNRDTNYYIVCDNQDQVRSIKPNLHLLKRLHPFGVVVTAPGTEVDFVSRYFAPRYGIAEDPVTGSIHCALAPYWTSRLGKPKLHARQLSGRGGDVFCEPRQNRVIISGG